MVELAVTGAAQPTLPFSVYGTIAMARTEDEPDSATSQVRGPLRGAKQRLAHLAGPTRPPRRCERELHQPWPVDERRPRLFAAAQTRSRQKQTSVCGGGLCGMHGG